MAPPPISDARVGLRLDRAAADLLVALAGLNLVTDPPSFVRADVHGWAWVWGVLLVAGGAASMAGALSGTWVGEYVGLPVVILVLASLAVMVATPPVAGSDFLAVLLGAFAVKLISRWRDTAAMRRGAVVAARARK